MVEISVRYRPPRLSRCMFEEDNSDFPLLWDSLINDASDSHLLDFPRFLCVALTQRVVQTSCEAPKSILPFPLLQHGRVFSARSVPTRSHRNPCRMLSSRTSLLLRAMLAISLCDPTRQRSASNMFYCVKVQPAVVVDVAAAGIILHTEGSPDVLSSSLTSHTL